MVFFHSIYPGWYRGRAPHLHVHVHDQKSKSVLITQIVFPEAFSKTIYKQGVYAELGSSQTSNAADNVFNDSIANELGILKGNIQTGFILQHAIQVTA